MLSLDLEGPKAEVEKAIVELKKTFDYWMIIFVSV